MLKGKKRFPCHECMYCEIRESTGHYWGKGIGTTPASELEKNLCQLNKRNESCRHVGRFCRPPESWRRKEDKEARK
jgi:hypothetical protein